jgi:type I restriction enzyme M protein
MNDISETIIQRLWSYCSVLRDDGVSYSDYVEQLTYLLFLKMADEQTKPPIDQESKIPQGLDWESLLRQDDSKLENHYKEILATLAMERGLLGTIFMESQNKIHDPLKLRHVIKLIDGETWLDMSADIKGKIYEGLLQKNAEDVKSGAGQYFTPRPLIGAILEVMRPQPCMTICDPACGTGGFFLAAYDYLSELPLSKEQELFLNRKTFRGCEIVPGAARLCVMNLYLRGIVGEESPIKVEDSLKFKPKEHFDMVLTNPPFGKKSSIAISNGVGKEERKSQSYKRVDFWVTTSNKQLNFLQHVNSLLKSAGKAAVVVPDNVLFEGGAGEVVRRSLLKECDVHTLLRLPTGIFYSQGVKANVLFFDRNDESNKPRADRFWIYDLRTNKHFTLKTNPLRPEDLREFVDCYNPENRHDRKKTERFRSFTYDELMQRDKVNLDIFWLKDESLEDSENLPEPEILAQEIVENLQSALEQFSSIYEDLVEKEVSEQF